MSRSWWPFRRRPDTSKSAKAPGDPERDRRLDETRRLVRHTRKRALLPEQGPEEPPPPLKEPSAPTVSVYGNIVHINFHQTWRAIEQTFVRRDPVTRKLKRLPRNFSRSDVFYTKDGNLIDDDTWVG